MNKKLIRSTESDLHRIVKESVNKVLREGGLRVNYGTDNESLEKKWFVYDRLIHKIIEAKDDLKRITGNQDPDTPYYQKKDERLWNFTHALDKVLAEYGFEDGFDPTEDMSW
jgi:hypothetical protein